MMKKLLVAVGFALAATGANANVVSGNLAVTGESTVNIVHQTAGVRFLPFQMVVIHQVLLER